MFNRAENVENTEWGMGPIDINRVENVDNVEGARPTRPSCPTRPASPLPPLGVCQPRESGTHCQGKSRRVPLEMGGVTRSDNYVIILA